MYTPFINTKRLILREWQESDVDMLYYYAKEKDIGENAGWPPHQNREESYEILTHVLQVPGSYAITLKEGTLIGAISYKASNKKDCLEIGCWCGKEHWGHGYIPEALQALIIDVFTHLGMSSLKYCYYEGNERSKRVAEKCGFTFDHKENQVEVPLLHEKRNKIVMILRREK